MSEQIKDGGPAFPTYPIHGTPHNPESDGMTLRQYAAIKLRVPESGDDWLDDMIRKSLRDEFAAKAVQGMLAYPHPDQASDEYMYARDAYVLADAMLRVREVKP